MNEYERLAIEYRGRFQDTVPTQELKGYSEKEMIELIKQALEDNKPIYIKHGDHIIY